MPSSLLFIENHCFDGCEKLTEISIPPFVTSIGDYAFSHCKELKEMIVPSSVSSIGDNFLFECSSLQKIIIPSNIKHIGKLNLSNCSLLDEFIIPTTITEIEAFAFSNCKSLTKIEIPSSITKIDRFAFCVCSSLKEIILPPSITSIEYCTFYECSSLIAINIPSSVTCIGYNAFGKCKSLIDVTITSNVKKISFNAFKDCESLKQITILKLKNKKEQKIEIICDSIIRFLFLGDSAVGKSSILCQYIDNKFSEVNMHTIGVDFKTKIFQIDGDNVKFQFWDTGGALKFDKINEAYYRSTDAFIIVFDLSRKNTLERAKEIFDSIIQKVGPTASILLGNKCDCDDRQVMDSEIREVEKKYCTKYFEISAKKNINVKDSIEYLAFRSYLNEKNKLKKLIYNDEDKKQDENNCNIQ